MQAAVSTQVRVRLRGEADDTFIAQLSAVAFGEYAPRAGVSTLRMAYAGRTWVALLDGEPVGFAIVHGFGAPQAELGAVAVEERARGRGVGNALLVYLEQALVRAGTRELTLHTAEANSSALDLFVKRGFSNVQRLPRFYRGVYAAWAMRKRIG